MSYENQKDWVYEIAVRAGLEEVGIQPNFPPGGSYTQHIARRIIEEQSARGVRPSAGEGRS